MKRLNEYIRLFDFYPEQIILKKVKQGLYYQGKLKFIPEIYLNYYVFDHTRLTKSSKVEFVIVEDIDI